MYALGPALFYSVLPEKYWKHFCKLVYGVQIIYQHKIQFADLQKAHDALIQFAHEFELLYNQQRPDHIHFVQQSIHGLMHLATEILCIGPGICSSQWTMERVIGSLGQEVCQPSNAFANLSRKAIQRCQVNALKAMVLNLNRYVPADIPQTAINVGNGFVLLRAQDTTAQVMLDYEKDALGKYFKDIQDIDDLDDEWHPMVTRWARLRLPNGQITCSTWKEKEKAKVQITRNAKVLALISVYSPPHAGLFEASNRTILSCTYHGDAHLKVIDISSIVLVVAMIPHDPFVDGDMQE
ncbi:hypothetical protein L208DRAFT_1331490 [Tricholoma matsutake]|nr:hypothetical protein L208DRAFT_1331490 [Tricholoma matsutake 945]